MSIADVLAHKERWHVEHGDAYKELQLLPGGSVDLIVTSPPYNLAASVSAQGHPNASRGSHYANRGYPECSDALPEPEYQQQQIAVLTELARVLKPGGSLCYVHKDRLNGGKLISPHQWIEPMLATQEGDYPLVLRQTIIIDRGTTHQNNPAYFAPVHEQLYWFTRGITHRNLGGLGKWGSVWHIPRETSPAFPHPAPMHYEIPRRCILALSRPGDLVADPYSGTGTTGAAALNYGRGYVGIDNVAAYVRLSGIRLSQLMLPLEELVS